MYLLYYTILACIRRFYLAYKRVVGNCKNGFTMKKLIIILLIFLSNNLVGQDIIKFSGLAHTIPNPCMTEICLPGIVWALENDTATYVLSKNNSWFPQDLIINNKKYNNNENINLYGYIKKEQDYSGNDFYKLEIINYEINDTIIEKNDTLNLFFSFPIFECGINIFSDPLNYKINELSYNQTYDSTKYTYVPINNFIGNDTIIFLTGCNLTPTKVIQYNIAVSNISKLNNIKYNFNIYPNPSFGTIHIENDINSDHDYILENFNGQIINKGKITKNIKFNIEKGLYVFTIIEKNTPIYTKKIIIK